MAKIKSEILKTGFTSEKPPEEMTAKELKEFRTKIEPDTMGFDGTEGVNENELCD